MASRVVLLGCAESLELALARCIFRQLDDRIIFRSGGFRADWLLGGLLRVFARERKHHGFIGVVKLTYAGIRSCELILKIIIFLRLNYFLVPVTRIKIT